MKTSVFALSSLLLTAQVSWAGSAMEDLGRASGVDVAPLAESAGKLAQQAGFEKRGGSGEGRIQAAAHALAEKMVGVGTVSGPSVRYARTRVRWDGAAIITGYDVKAAEADLAAYLGAIAGSASSLEEPRRGLVLGFAQEALGTGGYRDLYRSGVLILAMTSEPNPGEDGAVAAIRSLAQDMANSGNEGTPSFVYANTEAHWDGTMIITSYDIRGAESDLAAYLRGIAKAAQYLEEPIKGPVLDIAQEALSAGGYRRLYAAGKAVWVLTSALGTEQTADDSVCRNPETGMDRRVKELVARFRSGQIRENSSKSTCDGMWRR